MSLPQAENQHDVSVHSLFKEDENPQDIQIEDDNSSDDDGEAEDKGLQFTMVVMEDEKEPETPEQPSKGLLAAAKELTAACKSPFMAE